MYIDQPKLEELALKTAERIKTAFGQGKPIKCYPIPNTGIIIAQIVRRYLYFEIVDNPKEADFFLDDLIDSGKTLYDYVTEHGIPFFVLIDKDENNFDWIVWPWEGNKEGGIEDNITRLIQNVGEDPSRDGLVETPKRVAKAWQHWCSGYNQDPDSVLKVFEDGAEKCDQMVTVKDIPFYSHCEHHMAPIIGTATISYIPNGKIVGLSKLSRITEVFARRLQVQERLTNQIADAINDNLDPLGVGVFIEARHLCMESRGVCQQGHVTRTTALRGVIRHDDRSRDEFIRQV